MANDQPLTDAGTLALMRAVDQGADAVLRIADEAFRECIADASRLPVQTDSVNGFIAGLACASAIVSGMRSVIGDDPS